MIVEELIKTYDGKPVVDSVSFSLPKGKVTSLIGPNGAGKSTVMGMISRLIARDGGLVEFEGQDIGKWKSKELSKRLAILTQSNHIQMKLTVEELVAFGRFPYSGGRLTEEDKKMIDRAISYMELDEFRERFIDEQTEMPVSQAVPQDIQSHICPLTPLKNAPQAMRKVPASSHICRRDNS